MEKRYSCIILLMFIALVGNAQNYWLQDAGGATPDEALSCSLDDSSNIYTTGYFSTSATFGTNVLTAFGVSDVFVTKLNSNGVFEWAVQGGGSSGADRGLAIKADAKGNTYVTGFFYGTATFGTATITSAGLQDVFVAKYDRNGNLKWVVSAGGTQSDIGNAITIDKKGNVYVAGEFTGTAKFGTYTLVGTGSNINVFTARVDSATGNFLWAKSGTGPHTDRALGIACDNAGSVYVTGQYSDTITFDVPHYSTLGNAIFLVKYTSAGNEIWFTKAAGASYSISNAIATDNNSNVFLTGNFSGILTFYAKTITTLTDIYPDRIFIAKYDSAANLLWSVADGSSSPVSSNAIAIDSLGNPYLTGSFDCVFNSYADHYGQGTFNSVGYWDVFVSGYDHAAGAWLWSRQIGGHLNNYGNGIAVTPKGYVYNCGSFDKDVIMPTGGKYIGYGTGTWFYGCNGAYCSDSNYGSFGFFNTVGNLDVFIAEPADLSRQPYDYYMRDGSGCDKSYRGVCITDKMHTFDSCPDTLQYCQFGQIWVNSHTCSPLVPEAGPNFNYLWSTGANTTAIIASTTGWYTVTQTSADGCFKSTDSVYVIIHPVPPRPTISDNVVVNTNDSITNPIKTCKDSVRLTGSNYGSNSYYWVEPDSSVHYSSVIEVTKDGDYCFFVKTPYGCLSSTCVHVEFDSAMPPIKPAIYCVSCSHDTISVCKNTEFTLFAYDSISNPFINTFKCIPPLANTTVYWSVTPSTISYSPFTTCVDYDENFFLASDSGWYHVTATITRENGCDTSIIKVTDSIYVHFYPQPPPITLSITGKTTICPGDSTWLVAHGGPNYSWSNGSTADSIRVASGYYSVYCEVINTYGCFSIGLASVTVNYTPSPNITMNPSNGIICPGDSVALTCSGSGSFSWHGPSGPIASTAPVIYVTTPGLYYCVDADTNGCLLLSNTVAVSQYSTPYLAASPGQVICPGDTAKITVVAAPGSIINWLPPLGGNDTVKYILIPGTYKCTVTACGITTVDSVVVKLAHPFASITALGSTTFCTSDSLTLVGNKGGIASYLWEPGGKTTRTIKVDSSGTYTLTTTDTNGCVAKDSVTVTAVKPVTPAIILSRDSVCPNDSVTFTATGGSNYKWLPSGPITASIHVSSGTTTTYSVVVISACFIDTLAATVHIEPVPIITITGDTSICQGKATVLSASGALKYQWTPGGTNDTMTVSPSGTTTYTLTESNGACKRDTSVTVTVIKVSGAVSAKQDICKGETATLTASGGGTYQWSTGATTSSIKVSPDSTTYYSVVVSNGCPDSLKTSVIVVQPAITVCCNDTIVKGDTVTMHATGEASNTYSWTPDNSLSCNNCPDPVASPTVTTTYTVISTDSNGCQDTRMVTIYVISDCADFNVPNVFTPNDDGINDDFVVNPHDAETYSIDIYDRWGKQVYTSTDPKVYWNGKLQHTDYLVPDGVYYYIIKATCSGKHFLKKGFVEVIGGK